MIKTVELTGAETKVEGLDGKNTAIYNKSATAVYASCTPNVTPNADGVMEVPAGGYRGLNDSRGIVYLLGTGKVELTGTDDSVNFKMPSSSASSGGGATGGVSKSYVDAQDATNLGVAKAYTDTAVSAIAADVSTLQTDISAAQTGIAANAADIASNSNAISEIQADIAELRDDLTSTTAIAEAAQTAADTNAENIISTAESTLNAANGYTDTKASALDTRVTANTNAINTLNGTGEGSVKKTVSDGIAEIIADAPESLDTLKEISDWITSHSDSAAEMNSQIQDNSSDIATLQSEKADRSEIPTSLPANGGNADTVGGFTVGCDVPEDAVFTDTIVDISGKIDKTNPTGTGYISINRKPETSVGGSSTAIGDSNEASGYSSVAIGQRNIASHNNSVALGYANEASGDCSVAVASGNLSSGDRSFAAGENNIASGHHSTAMGQKNVASGDCSVAIGGHDNTASHNFSVVTGTGNQTARDYQVIIGSWNAAREHAILIAGYGDNADYRLNNFRIDEYNGGVYSMGSYYSSGADYAEFIKPWSDGNPNNEDRVGYFVTIKNGGLCFAEEGDYIVGITSGNPSVVGNGDEDWLGRWQRDEFNRVITEDSEEEKPEIDEETGKEETGEVVCKKAGQVIKNVRLKANPDYDPSQKYIERKNRPEWDYVGMIGVLPLRDDGTCVPGGFAKCGAGGVATAADEWECHKTFFVIERISDNVISVEMR